MIDSPSQPFRMPIRARVFFPTEPSSSARRAAWPKLKTHQLDCSAARHTKRNSPRFPQTEGEGVIRSPRTGAVVTDLQYLDPGCHSCARICRNCCNTFAWIPGSRMFIMFPLQPAEAFEQIEQQHRTADHQQDHQHDTVRRVRGRQSFHVHSIKTRHYQCGKRDRAQDS
jgi:hypothetical protein